MSDIELTAPWTPVSSFSGTLDGNGHVISGLQISGAGFFSSTEEGAVIRNLGLEGTVNHPGSSPAGALVGRANGSTTITGCYTNVAVTADSMEHVGGIVGEARAACVIENCYSLGTLTGGTSFAYAGGIIGKKRKRGNDGQQLLYHCGLKRWDIPMPRREAITTARRETMRMRHRSRRIWMNF